MARLQLALDIGGTFTDVVMVDGASGALWTAKTPSTPRDPSNGFFDGVEKILRLAGTAPADVAAVFHGSTIATNAVLEGKGARTGMLVTAGFRYVLEIGRHEIPRKENLFVWRKPKRPVPPRLIMEVPERVLLDGSVERPLDEAACRDAARRLRALGVEAVAIVFLHSYANPAHERRAAEIVAEEFPEAAISISSDVLPVFREYERSMATALNAYVQRLVGTYIGRLQTGLEKRNVAAPLLVMKSNGGVFGPRQADRQAINMALSGPAAGVIGASFVARAAGFDNSVTIDIGGTSADVSLIRGGAAGHHDRRRTWAVSAGAADHRHPFDRRRRRIARPRHRHRQPAGWAGKRRRRPGPGVLRPRRRQGDRDRRARRIGPRAVDTARRRDAPRRAEGARTQSSATSPARLASASRMRPKA